MSTDLPVKPCERCGYISHCVCRFITDEHLPAYKKLTELGSRGLIDLCIDGDGTVTTDLPSILEIVSGDL